MATKQVTSLRMEQKFKKTPAGEIPVEWEAVRIEDAADVYGGGTPDRKIPEYWNGSIPWATPTNVTAISGTTISGTKETIAEPGLKNSAAILMPSGSVLMTSRATLGYSVINTVPMATNQGFANFICKDNIHNLFLLYLLYYKRSDLEKLGAGSTFLEIPKSALRKLVVPLPPLPEQKKIAEILSAVDDAIEKTDAVIEKTKELKKGLMQQLLTCGLPARGAQAGIGHKKFKKTEVGEIPVEWEVVKLGEHLDVYSGYAFKSQDFLERGEGSIPVIKIGSLQNGIVTFDDKTDYVSEKLYDELVEFRLGKGDVLIALSGATTGKISVVHKDLENALVNQRVGKFKILNTTKMLPGFFYYLAQADVFKKIVLVNIGKGAQENLSPLELKKQMIPLPPLPEQQKIAEILSVVDDEISMEENRKQQLEQTKKTLMQVLLTGKVRVDS